MIVEIPVFICLYGGDLEPVLQVIRLLFGLATHDLNVEHIWGVFLWASQVTQMVKNLPATQETWV